MCRRDRDVDDIQASTENLKTYIKERQQIINDYNAGKFGEDEYNQKLKDVDAEDVYKRQGRNY